MCCPHQQAVELHRLQAISTWLKGVEDGANDPSGHSTRGPHGRSASATRFKAIPTEAGSENMKTCESGSSDLGQTLSKTHTRRTS